MEKLKTLQEDPFPGSGSDKKRLYIHGRETPACSISAAHSRHFTASMSRRRKCMFLPWCQSSRRTRDTDGF